MRVYLSETLTQLGVAFSAPKPGDAGYDLYATEARTLPPGARATIPTGVYLEIPANYVGLVKDRSSMAQAGLHSLGGVIDSSYRGEVKLILLNTTGEVYEVKAGQKVAQLIVLPCYTEALVPVPTLTDLSSSERGDRGFGSTGE